MRISSVTTVFLLFLLLGCSTPSLRKGSLELSMEEFLANPVWWVEQEIVLVGMFGGSDSSRTDQFWLLSRVSPVWEEGGEVGIVIRSSSAPYLPYEVLRVEGRVRLASPDQFYLDASDIRSWGDPLFTPESLSLLRTGLSGKEVDRARERLWKALQGPLSYAARYVAHMKVGVLLESAGRYAEAMKHFRWAIGFTNDLEKESVSRASLERVGLLEEKRRLIDGLEED